MIDTRAAIQDLKAAGADPKLTEAIVKTVSRADAQPATKADLTALEGRIDSLEPRLTAAGCRLALGVVVVNASIVFGLLKAHPAGVGPPSGRFEHPRSSGRRS